MAQGVPQEVKKLKQQKMNREIKFRAWEKFAKQMLYEGHTETANGNSMYCSKTTLFMLGENAEIMQFTGLHDKNGKEIYEGDICIVQIQLGGFWGNTPNPKTAQIFYDTDGAGYIAKWEWAKNQHYERLTCDIDCEVVGNIYENPELLK